MHTEEFHGNDLLRSVLGAVMLHNTGKWLRYIVTILKNEADAEDAIQEAVCRVLARDLSFGSESQVKMYVGRAVANAAFELYNQRKRERLRRFPVNEQVLLPARSNPFAFMHMLEKRGEKERLLALLDEGLNHLPVKQYEALRFTILESFGLSIRDVGTRTGIPYSTLRHRTRQGIRGLRRFIEKKRATTE
jgi:RNA polymerase sigma factor (sigma-70 family)